MRNQKTCKSLLICALERFPCSPSTSRREKKHLNGFFISNAKNKSNENIVYTIYTYSEATSAEKYAPKVSDKNRTDQRELVVDD